MNTAGSWKKLDDGSWGVRVPGGTHATGERIEVQTRAGKTSEVTLGSQIASFATRDGDFDIFRAAANGHGDEEVEPGVYELPGGAIYVVKPNRDKTHVYAKRLVETAARLTEEDERVSFDFEYESGAIRHIRPEHRMDIERAKALAIRYGRCLNCGRRLKAADSVERGIGPICMKAFKHSPLGETAAGDTAASPVVETPRNEYGGIVTSREEARELLTKKIERSRKLLADPNGFSTYDPNLLIEDAEFRLRWIDCAPEGANHICAPMQDKRGVPMGNHYNENIGPNKALREARERHGVHPLSGERQEEVA